MRICPGVRTHVTPVAAVTAISRRETTASGQARCSPVAGLWPCPQVRTRRATPAASVLCQVVRDHYQPFLAEASQLREGEGLPRFADDRFDAFLRCGWYAGGFARFYCTSCRAERLVAFSCKGRGFCPSCGGRRMTERAARLVGHVWPEVPVRQWV